MTTNVDGFGRTLADWQDEIRATVAAATATPLEAVDGSGCDSGDPLELTKAEIEMAVSWMADRTVPLEHQSGDPLVLRRILAQAEQGGVRCEISLSCSSIYCRVERDGAAAEAFTLSLAAAAEVAIEQYLDIHGGCVNREVLQS